MANEQKRYYWLKLGDDFFNQKEIKKLRNIAGGDTFTIIYLKMLLKSMKNGGKLYYEGIEDSFVSELALDIDEDEDNVGVTVRFLIAKGILIQNTQSEYEVLTANEMMGSECESARRVRKMRAIKAMEQPLLEEGEALHCNGGVTKCNTEKEKEKEKEPPIAPKGSNSIFPGFDDFWKTYPRKAAKVAARKAWDKLKPNDDTLQAILKDIQRRRDGAWKDAEERFIPHPATYLNQRRWEDEVGANEPQHYESIWDLPMEERERMNDELNQREYEAMKAAQGGKQK